MEKVRRNRTLLWNRGIGKLNFCLFLLSAMFLIKCEGDHSTPNSEFFNPLANPQDGPPAGILTVIIRFLWKQDLKIFPRSFLSPTTTPEIFVLITP